MKNNNRPLTKYSCINCKQEYQSFSESSSSQIKELKVPSCRNCHSFWTKESVAWEKKSSKVEKFLRKQQKQKNDNKD